VEILAVASREPTRAETYAGQQGIPRAHGSYEALLNDADVQVVYNPLPNSLHAPWSIRALEAGKAVLCEKPLASNAAEAVRMIGAARSASRPLIEAFHYRCHPLAQFIAEHVQSGRLGRLRHIRAALNIPGRLLASDDIRFRDDLAGGATMDLGSYCINILRLIAGDQVKVVSASASLVSPNIDGAMKARLIVGDAQADLECSLVHDSLESRVSIEGELGTLVAENPFLPQMGNAVNMRVIDSVYRAAGLGVRGAAISP
jgi:predicted dehydrogenase